MVRTLSCYMYSTSKQAKANNIDLQYEPVTEHIKHKPLLLQNINFSRRPSIQRQNDGVATTLAFGGRL